MNSAQWLAVALVLALASSAYSQGGFNGASLIEKMLLCALDQAPCDALGQQIKRALPEIIGNGCQLCNPQERANAKRIARFVQSRYPEAWKALVEKYTKEKEEEEEQANKYRNAFIIEET